jgi:hypothetical protein
MTTQDGTTMVETWRERGMVLSRARRLQQFEIADWLVEGTGLFEDASAAYDFAEQTFPDVARQTFINWVSVAHQFPTCMRIQSDWLTFSHYQVALGARGCLGAGSEKQDDGPTLIQHARLTWLQQAHDNRMTVADLRLAITNEWELSRSTQPTASEPEPVTAPQTTVAPRTKPQINFLEAPVYRLLPRHQYQIIALAQARKITPEILVVDAVAEYLAAHADEVGDAMDKAKEESERKFRTMVAAAKHADQQTRWRLEALHERRRMLAGRDSLSRCFPDDEPAFAEAEVPTFTEQLEAA